MKGLKPCPFCGGWARTKTHTFLSPITRCITPRRKRHLLRRHYVMCMRCGAQTSLHKTWDECVEAWNGRTHD